MGGNTEDIIVGILILQMKKQNVKKCHKASKYLEGI